jgi:hypothetical protein
MADAPRWVAHVHGDMPCDHAAANTAAGIVLAMEALGPALPADEEALLAERIRERCLAPFLRCCRERSIFWAQRDHRFNWRIMTCGEAGLAVLGLDVPERAEVVEFALEGVADILDRLPEEGDWEEGPGYWAATLLFGLQFALALDRLTAGRVDLFAHPALRATADYFTCVTLPDGATFNYGDNSPAINPTALHLLAARLRSGTLAFTARRMGRRSAWDLLFDAPSVRSGRPGGALKARVFPTTGIGVARSDWGGDAVFAGLKSGPTAVGHSHLDIQSFVVSRGAVPLVVDPGIWPYAHFLGFFDGTPEGRRWDFDANATVAHSTVLADGRGQTIGPQCAGRIAAHARRGRLSYFVSDGAAAYPGLLTRFDRWLILVAPDLVIVYDDLASDRPRHWEWLLHAAGTVSATRTGFEIENEGVRLSGARLLPGVDAPWRAISEARTSCYQDSNALRDVERSISLHRFGPMLPSEEIEFLWVMRVGAGASGWSVERPRRDVLLVRGDVCMRLDRARRRCSLIARKEG